MKRTISNTNDDTEALKCNTWWIDNNSNSKLVGKCDDDLGCFEKDETHCTSTCIDKLGEKPDGTCGRFKEYISEKIFY